MRCVLSLVLLLLVAAAAARQLVPRKYEPLPLGAVTPKGWLLTQLQLQADGLSGHLALFWPDIMSSIWIGGVADADLHERTPYWLNGVVPLAFQLANARTAQQQQQPQQKQRAEKKHPHARSLDSVCQEGVDMPYGDILTTQVRDAAACRDLCNATDACLAFVVDDCDARHVQCWLKSESLPLVNQSCRCLGIMPPRPPRPVNLMAQVHEYLNYILAHQAPDGWLGPPDSADDGNKYWGRFDVVLSLIMYAEANATAYPQVTASLLKFFLGLRSRLAALPLEGWAASRGMDLALGIQWLLDHDPQGHEADLFALLDTVQRQTLNWELWFDTFTQGANNHGVNNAQALKSSAVWYRNTGNQSFADSSRRRMANMDRTYGFPHGAFCADELLCDNNQLKMPSRGTELCTVVEAMFSYTTLFSVHGDIAFADRAERIAFNALPATFSSPRGGDMWAHQYLQAVNEINAMSADDHVWTHDGPDAQLYGLEPNFGCCTANFNQGWPKLVNMLFYLTPDGGIAVGIFAPADARIGSATISVDTTYPFEDVIRVTLTTPVDRNLYLRIPSWAAKAKLTVNGSAVPVVNGTMQRIACRAGTTLAVLTLNPDVRLEHWYSGGTVSIHRGPLLFALPINGAFTTLHRYAFESADYQVLPTSTWAYAIDVTAPLTVSVTGLQAGAAPFNKTAPWPLTITASARSYPSWGISHNSAAAPPVGPVCARGGCGAVERLVLIPYGGTTLRIGELPLA
eukprot:m.42587 g.42587  ORF g.42587 m.42587 type:complete len:742 (+) comp10676_c0_seq1:42-2267(+)